MTCGALIPLGFAELSAWAELHRVDDVQAPICSLADLVVLKRIVGRERDLVDLRDLDAAHGECPTVTLVGMALKHRCCTSDQTVY